MAEVWRTLSSYFTTTSTYVTPGDTAHLVTLTARFEALENANTGIKIKATVTVSGWRYGDTVRVNLDLEGRTLINTTTTNDSITPTTKSWTGSTTFSRYTGADGYILQLFPPDPYDDSSGATDVTSPVYTVEMWGASNYNTWYLAIPDGGKVYLPTSVSNVPTETSVSSYKLLDRSGNLIGPSVTSSKEIRYEWRQNGSRVSSPVTITSDTTLSYTPVSYTIKSPSYSLYNTNTLLANDVSVNTAVNSSEGTIWFEDNATTRKSLPVRATLKEAPSSWLLNNTSYAAGGTVNLRNIEGNLSYNSSSNTYTATFIPNYTGQPQKISYDTVYKAEFPAPSSWTGHIFKGWADSSGNIVQSVQLPDNTRGASETLQALWSANSYTVTIVNWPGGQLKKIVTYGSSGPLNISDIEVETGYEFTGVADASGVLIWDSTGQPVPNTKYRNSSGDWKYNNNVTAYLVFTQTFGVYVFNNGWRQLDVYIRESGMWQNNRSVVFQGPNDTEITVYNPKAQ